MTEKTQAELLSEPFDEILIYQRSVGGRRFDYVTVAEYIARLNKVLGTGNWNYEIVKCHIQPEYKDSVIAQVRVTAKVDGTMAVKEGYGGAKVKILKSGSVMDLGNDFKSAVSDAFKKACQGFGIALHLARSEESLALDVEESYPVDSDKWHVFAENFKGLSDEKKDSFREWFNEKQFGESKPNRSMKVEDFDASSVEVIRLMFDGATVVEKEETF